MLLGIACGYGNCALGRLFPDKSSSPIGTSKYFALMIETCSGRLANFVGAALLWQRWKGPARRGARTWR
jgi:hypothetical protein